MVLVRRLVLATMKYNVFLRACHIPGKANVLPDLLSRFQIERFHQLAPHMLDSPVRVPADLLKL